MKTINRVIGLTLFLTSPVFALGDGWTSDFEGAKRLAAKEKKDLIVEFTGSDWCTPCKALNQEVFSQDAFRAGVSDDYILVGLDYPSEASSQDPATREANESLAKQFDIEGYPSVVLMDSKGLPYAQTGYLAGGAEAYLKHLDKLQNHKKIRDEGFARAEKAEGLEKAKALASAIKVVPSQHRDLYGDVEEIIMRLDTEDVIGLVAEKKAETAMEGLENELSEARKSGDSAEQLKLIDDFIATYQPTGISRQKVLGTKINLLMNQENFDEASELLNEIIQLDPNSNLGRAYENFRPQFQKMRESAEAKTLVPEV